MTFKATLLASHGRECPYCGVVMRVERPRPTKRPFFPTKDHIIPRSLRPGGRVMYVCLQCNQDKQSRTLDLWLHVLRSTQDPRAVRVRAFMDENPPHIWRVSSKEREDHDATSIHERA